MADKPKGQLFSRTYLDPGPMLSDSKRLRGRLASWVGQHMPFLDDPVREVRNELGVNPLPPGKVQPDWAYYFETVEMRDVADTITILFNAIYAAHQPILQPALVAFAERAMREENVNLTVDEAGGVHFFVDEEFQRARVSTIFALAASGNKAAQEAYESGLKSMIGGDTLQGVRGVFDAAEGLLKHAFGTTLLGSAEINKLLKPKATAYYSGRAGDAANQLLTGYTNWVNATHQYRHADGEPEPTPPPLDLAVAMISTGSAFIRWMLETNFLRR